MSDEQVIQYCAPTLAGLKTGNLFTCPVETPEQMRETIRRWNRVLGNKGLRILPLRQSRGRILVYVYRPERLRRDLGDSDARRLLDRLGYTGESADQRLVEMILRLRGGESFPHEIGMFLGYPPEDVAGFMEHRAKDCKCVGDWKVYGDEAKAQALFAQYKKCTAEYCRRWKLGASLEQLAVTA